MKYRVTFDYCTSWGEWVENDFTGNGEGYTREEAEQLAAFLNLPYDETSIPTRNARLVPV